MIPFNKPYLTGNETKYIEDAVKTGKISGNGIFTKKVQRFFEDRYQISKALLTTSCTDALEMAAILLDLNEGDEVIVPSYTFVSSALAFVREKANIVFADSSEDHPNMDANLIESLITNKTKAIVVVHYAGVANDMEKIMAIAKKWNLIVIEDAAQSIESYYTFSNGEKKALGSIGDLSTFSFHETKNIISGEGGLLGINNPKYFERAEILWEKGTNRNQFFRGEVDKYGWVDTGSSFLPSEIISAFLWAQLEQLEDIQNKRIDLWNKYHEQLLPKANDLGLTLSNTPSYATNNGHMYYLLAESLSHRNEILAQLKKENILAVFHYQSLHESAYYKDKHDGRILPHTKKYTERLFRLPLFYELKDEDIDCIVKNITK